MPFTARQRGNTPFTVGKNNKEMSTMKNDHKTTRQAQDSFHSMVGETGPYPNDPQHPDPGFDVEFVQGDSATNDPATGDA